LIQSTKRKMGLGKHSGRAQHAVAAFARERAGFGKQTAFADSRFTPEDQGAAATAVDATDQGHQQVDFGVSPEHRGDVAHRSHQGM
jgi:hypothetical protein